MLTLMRGDCLEKMKELPDCSIDMVLTDPPYGTTACKWDSVLPFDKMWTEINRVAKPEAAIVLFGSQPFTTMLISSNIKMFKYNWIWEKNRPTNFPNAKRRPLTGHEEIMVFMKSKLKYYPQKSKGHQPTNSAKGKSRHLIYNGKFNTRDYAGGDTERFPKTILKFNCERGFHPTQKPVPLLEYLIKTYTLESETVLDFTMGSGSTGVACKNLNRHFIGIEKDETYFNIANERTNR